MTCVFFSKTLPLKTLLLSITLLLPAIMLLLPVCAKILSKYLAALLPLNRHQNLLLYSNWCQFSNNFPHLPISTFSLQIQSCWYRIREKKIQYLIHHSGWLQTSVMFPIYSATDKRVVGNGQVPETESLKTFVYLFMFMAESYSCRFISGLVVSMTMSYLLFIFS